MPNFSTTLLSLVLISGIATAFIDQDRRGLAFFTEPEAFFVEEKTTPEPVSFPVAWGESPTTLSRLQKTTRSQDRSLSRTPVQQLAQAPRAVTRQPISVASSPPAPAPAAPAASSPASQASASNVSPTVQASPAPAAVSAGGSAPVIQPVPSGLTLDPLVGLPTADGLTGGNLVLVETDLDIDTSVETTTVDPVVPAVPEPSSWILMVLGVGLLGMMLRYRREEDDEGMTFFASDYRTA